MKKKNGNGFEVSVIMRTKDSCPLIGEVLKALFDQTFNSFELVVIDSGSTDKTLEEVAKYPHKLLKVSAYFPGKVLNQAIKASSGRILVLLNSDVTLASPESLANLLGAFKDKRVKATFGRQLPRPDAESWVRGDYARAYPSEGNAPPWLLFSSALAAIRRSAWEEHSFYTDAHHSEDEEWGNWAKNKGYKIAYVPEATGIHSHNYNPSKLYWRKYAEGRASAVINEIYRNKKYGLLDMCKNIISSILKDLPQYAKDGNILGFPKALPLRIVYHFAFWQGYRHGRYRAIERDADVEELVQKHRVSW